MSDADFDTPEPTSAPVKRPTKGPTVAERTQAAESRAKGEEAPTKDEGPKAEIVALVERAPADVLKSEEHLAALYKHIEGEIAAFAPNLETVTGRKAVASLSYKITRTKTALDEAGKTLNEGLRKRIEAVDVLRRGAREKLDALADLARKPLDDWEAAEKLRTKTIDIIERTLSARIDPLATSKALEELIKGLGGLTIDEEVIGSEEAERLTTKRDDLIADLVITKERTLRAEEDAAERKRLQAIADQAEQERRDREAEDARRQQQEQQRQEDEARRAQNEQHIRDCATRAGEARGFFAAVENAPATESLHAQVEIVKTDGALVGPDNSAELSHWKERILRRIRADLNEAEAELARKAHAAEDAKAHEADEAARRAMRTTVRNKLMELGAEKPLANTIALAIVNGEVPHLSINYAKE